MLGLIVVGLLPMVLHRLRLVLLLLHMVVLGTLVLGAIVLVRFVVLVEEGLGDVVIEAVAHPLLPQEENAGEYCSSERPERERGPVASPHRIHRERGFLHVIVLLGLEAEDETDNRIHVASRDLIGDCVTVEGGNGDDSGELESEFVVLILFLGCLLLETLAERILGVKVDESKNQREDNLGRENDCCDDARVVGVAECLCGGDVVHVGRNREASVLEAEKVGNLHAEEAAERLRDDVHHGIGPFLWFSVRDVDGYCESRIQLSA